MPNYVVFRRYHPYDGDWTVLATINAMHDLDAWYDARWCAQGNTIEVLPKRVGFWAIIRGNYEKPSPSEKGKPPYTPEERQRIKNAVSREHGQQIIAELNETE